MLLDLRSSIALASPELFLAIAAMVLLMIGVSAGRKASMLVTSLAIVVLAIGAVVFTGAVALFHRKSG